MNSRLIWKGLVALVLAGAATGSVRVWASSQCPPTRYQVEESGLVDDGATGLTWQQHVAPTRVVDGGVSQTYDWAEATTYCSALGSGWRLPSLTELQTIVDETRESPAIDVNVFTDTPPKGYFWTSSPQAGSADGGYSGYAWYVSFFHGHTGVDVDTNN